MAASWGENTWSSSGWGGGTLIDGNSAAGAVGSLTASISIDIGISRFLLEDGSGYLLLEDGSYLMEEAGTGPIPSINGAVGSVAQATALTGVAEASAVGSTTPSITVDSTGVFATGNAGTNPADTSELLVGVAASGGAGSLTPSITVSIVPGWGTGAWGSGAWGSATPAIAGAVGSNGVEIQVASIGNAAAGQTGTTIYNRIEFITGVQELGAVGGVTPSTTITIGISRFLLEDDSGYLLLEDGSYLMEEAGTGPIPSINASVGSVSQSSAFSVTGVESAANVGSVVPSTTVSIATSWGTGAWGYGSWGGAQAAIIGSVGSVVYSPVLIGVQANGSVGQLTQSLTIGLTSVSTNGAVGTVAPATSVALDSKWGIGAWGAGTWSSGLLIVGAVNEMIAVSPAITGVRADGLAGTPVSNITVAITGAASQGAVGYLAAVKTALLSGVAATGNVGVLGVVKSYWDIIDDAQNANWAEIDNAQTAAWAAISNAQNASWTQITNAQSPGWGVVSDAQTAGWELIPNAFDQN